MDGGVIWIYVIFLFIVHEKKLKEVNLSDKFQRHTVNNFKAILNLLSRVEAFK